MKHATTRHATRKLCEGAVLVAVAFVLGLLKLFHMPQGGSVSLLMLPILIYAIRWGLPSGLLAGCALGVLDFMLGGGIAIGWQSILGDYVIACTLLGLAGLSHPARNKLWGVLCGCALGALGRFASVWFTGATLWGSYMPEGFSFLGSTSAWVYSAWYNFPVLVSGAVALAAACVLYSIPATRKYLTGGDIPQ